MPLYRVVLLTMLFLNLFAGISPSRGGPVIQNASFEEVDKDNKPTGWAVNSWGNADVSGLRACSIVKMAGTPNGKNVARVVLDKPQHAAFVQNLNNLVPGAWYEVSGMIRSENLAGHGARLCVEYWQGSAAYGCLDSEPIVKTTDWQKTVIRFQAPSKDYRVQLDFMASGSSGEAWADNLMIRRISSPSVEANKRKILKGSFWGMFPWPYDLFEKNAPQMREAGVYWIRMGGASTSPEMQKIAQKYGMVFETCFDGMPGANDPNDPCYPITNSDWYRSYIIPYIKQSCPTTRVWEIFNEPNNNLSWALPAYSNLLNVAGKAIKETNPKALMGTGGFAIPNTGYVNACLRGDTNKYIDIVLIHPYAVDEGLDSQLVAVAEACDRFGRSDIPVAINESGWPTWDPDTGYKELSQFVSEETQASNIVKLHVQGLAHRMSFINYLTWQDFTSEGDQSHNMGLIRVDGSKKQSYYAYRFMTKHIGDRRIKKWSYQKTGCRIYEFDGSKPLWVIWNALNDETITFDTGTTEVFPCDMYGAKKTVQPVHGKVDLKIGNTPIYLIPVEK